MDYTVLVSVVIPCYNVEEYIWECLESIRLQTYQKLEIICVDNNSTDATSSIVDRFKRTFPELEVLLIKEDKPGAPCARNKGLANAKGSLIQFLDADDLLLSTKIERQVGVIKGAGGCDFVSGAYVRKYYNGNEQIVSIPLIDPWTSLPMVQLGITSSNLFHKDMLLRIGGWKEGLRSSQEYDLMFRLLKKGARVVFDNEPLTVVRERISGSITQTDIIGNNLRRLDHLCEIRQYVYSAKLGSERLLAVEQAIFQEIRRIYKVDKSLATKKFENLFDVTPKISSSDSTSRIYVSVYNVFGFKIAQIINSVYQKMRS